MSCLVDANVLIAYAHRGDENHDRAIELLRQTLSDKAYGSAYVTDYVIDEVLTFLGKRGNNKEKTIELGKFLLSSNFLPLFTPPDVFEKSWTVFQRTKELSFTDCTLAVHLKENGIGALMSFDSGFDQLGIRRIK